MGLRITFLILLGIGTFLLLANMTGAIQIPWGYILAPFGLAVGGAIIVVGLILLVGYGIRESSE